ncbi:hypothetical protein EDB85DRAFT_2139664 [Lactarius pseudohatsudake]|nr:hypothetical protein EDB85DRAFT_2139664 [Lactarius pseudohatsudake]
MNRPRESLLNLFDPLFSAQPSTPPSCPSPDLGSDMENAAPLGDSPITFTKFFDRTYTRYKSLSDDDGQVSQDECEPVIAHHETDIVLGDGSSWRSAVSIPNKARQLRRCSGPSFRLARPTPAPSSSPLPSVIDAISGTSRTPRRPLHTLHYYCTYIAPAATFRASPDADARRVSVDSTEAVKARGTIAHTTGRPSYPSMAITYYLFY